MNCKYKLNLPAVCTSNDCKTCEFAGKEHLCPRAEEKGDADNSVTFRLMLDIYAKHSGASVRHVANVVNTVTSDLAELGYNIDSKCSVMTRDEFKRLIQLLSDPNRVPRTRNHQNGKLADITIASHLSAFKSLVKDNLLDYYCQEGFTYPSLQIPQYEVANKPIQEMTNEQAWQFDIQMVKWLASGRKSDRNCFIYAFFARRCGMRAGDICNCKWDIIKYTDVGVMVAYVPRKSITKKCPMGKLATYILPNEVFCMIQPLMKGPDEYLIPRESHYAPKRSRRNGEYVGFHRYLRDKVNKALSGIGIGTEYPEQKKTHALRKFFETDIALRDGDDKAATACGHTVAVQHKFYKGSLLKKTSRS